MKPKILNDLTNIFAKLAGSNDYDPKVHYDTPLEYYANQVPVLPKPELSDDGKTLTVDNDGAYTLQAPIVPKPGSDDGGKILVAESSGTYALQVPIVPTPGPNDVGKVPTADSDGTYTLIAPTVEVSPDAVAGAIADMDNNEVAVVESRLNYVTKPVVTAVSGATPTIALCEDNHIYECGELTSLTVTAIDNPASFIIRFASGATATLVTLPVGMIFPDTFTPEINTRYEINCVDGYALAVGWPYTPTPRLHEVGYERDFKA